MKAGRMDRLVTLRLRTVTDRDDYGEQEERWEEVPAWAERRDLRGAERFVAQQHLASLTARYRIHYRTDVTSRDELKDENGNTYNIHEVLEVGYREGLELLVAHREGE